MIQKTLWNVSTIYTYPSMADQAKGSSLRGLLSLVTKQNI